MHRTEGERKRKRRGSHAATCLECQKRRILIHTRTDRQTNHFAHPSSSIYRVPNDLKTILMSFKSGSDPSKLGMMLLCYLFFQSRHPLSLSTKDKWREGGTEGEGLVDVNPIYSCGESR